MTTSAAVRAVPRERYFRRKPERVRASDASWAARLAPPGHCAPPPRVRRLRADPVPRSSSARFHCELCGRRGEDSTEGGSACDPLQTVESPDAAGQPLDSDADLRKRDLRPTAGNKTGWAATLTVPNDRSRRMGTAFITIKEPGWRTIMRRRNPPRPSPGCTSRR